MKNVQPLRWLVLVVILVVGVSVWAYAESSSPSTPEIAKHPANFYAGRGFSDEYGAYVGNEVFVVQVPAGDYLLRYKTNVGTFDLVLRATEKALLYVGLVTGDKVIDAFIYPGTVFDTSRDTQAHGIVTLFVWPGSSITWRDVFRMQ